MSAQETAEDGLDGEPAWPQGPDLDLFGLQVDPDDPCRSRFVIEPHLCRRDGALYGGAALGVTLAAFEVAAERAALWATVQFVGVASMGETIECRVDPVARGRAVHQLQVTATVGDRLIFSALGAAAEPRRDAIAGGGRVMPVVEAPDDARSLGFEREGDAHTVGHYLRSEFREVEMADPTSSGHYAMWARIFGQDRTTAAGLGFLADMVPIAVCRAAGVEGAGTSLDNSLRVGRLVDTEWVLVELEAHVAAGGYGYGVSHLWSPDGTLMATGSQTAKLFSFASFLERQG